MLKLSHIQQLFLGRGAARNGGLGLRRDAQTPRRAYVFPLHSSRMSCPFPSMQIVLNNNHINLMSMLTTYITCFMSIIFSNDLCKQLKIMSLEGVQRVN